MPVEDRNCSPAGDVARVRGCGPPVIGSCTKKFMLSVLCLRNGSARAVSGSGKQRHVGLVDRMEAAHGRASKGDAAVDEVLVETRSRGRSGAA